MTTIYYIKAGEETNDLLDYVKHIISHNQYITVILPSRKPQTFHFSLLF